MKSLLITIGCVFLVLGLAYSDQAAGQTAETFPPEVRANVQQMIGIGLDEDDLVNLTQTMLQHRFETRQILQSQEILSKSHQLGLPTRPVTNKAFEGMSKNIPADNIIAAMEQVHSRYAFAYAEVGKIAQPETQTSQLGNMLAGSLAAGIGREDAKTIIAALHARSQSQGRAATDQLAHASLRMARDIARLGVSSRNATAVVVQALDNNLSAKDITALHASFVAQSKQTPPEKLAVNYSRAIMSGQSVQSLGAKESAGRQGSPGRTVATSASTAHAAACS